MHAPSWMLTPLFCSQEEGGAKELDFGLCLAFAVCSLPISMFAIGSRSGEQALCPRALCTEAGALDLTGPLGGAGWGCGPQGFTYSCFAGAQTQHEMNEWINKFQIKGSSGEQLVQWYTVSSVHQRVIFPTNWYVAIAQEQTMQGGVCREARDVLSEISLYEADIDFYQCNSKTGVKSGDNDDDTYHPSSNCCLLEASSLLTRPLILATNLQGRGHPGACL